MATFNYYKNETSPAVNLYDKWDHPDFSIFTKKTFSNYKGPNGALSGILNPSPLDTWRVCTSAKMWDGSTQLQCIDKGYLPTYEIIHIGLSSGRWYRVTRSDSYLIVGSTIIDKSKFRGGVVPHYLLFSMYAGGGGGGGTWGTDDGTGGGAGAYMSCIVCVDSGLQILVGAGGAGGYKKEVSSTAGQGGGGTATSIFTGATINASNSGITGGTCICSCYGGGPGRASTKGEAYPGGSGGDPHVYTGCYCAYTRKGGTGGKVYGLANATGCAALNVYASASTSYKGYALRAWSATSGGKQGHNNAPGGGGGSMFQNGVAGAGSTSDGKNGYAGSGGSGARFTLAVYKRGGKGGPGYVDIYY